MLFSFEICRNWFLWFVYYRFVLIIKDFVKVYVFIFCILVCGLNFLKYLMSNKICDENYFVLIFKC